MKNDNDYRTSAAKDDQEQSGFRERITPKWATHLKTEYGVEPQEVAYFGSLLAILVVAQPGSEPHTAAYRQLVKTGLYFDFVGNGTLFARVVLGLSKQQMEQLHESDEEGGAMPRRGTVAIWTLLNSLARDHEPESRRHFRLQLLFRLKALIHQGRVFRIGRTKVALERPAPRTSLPRVPARRRNASGPSQTTRLRSSTHQRSLLPAEVFGSLEVDDQGLTNDSVPVATCIETKSVTDSSVREISDAGRDLWRLRGRKKMLTGYLNPADRTTRMWRDRRILLPDGTSAFVYGVRRGLVVWTMDMGRLLGWFDEVMRWGVIEADQVRLWKDPVFVALGRLKAGSKERPSERKKAAVRANGRRPCRPGRRRGRPPVRSGLGTAHEVGGSLWNPSA